jgi:serine/threonine protein kinase
LPIAEGYKLIKLLGQGSFGEVWRDEAPGGVDVAVKIISRPLNHETSQRELQALELIKRLRHLYLLSTQAASCSCNGTSRWRISGWRASRNS